MSSTTFMEFPPERQAAIEAAQQNKMRGARQQTGFPSPVAVPVADRGPMQQQGPQHAGRAPMNARAIGDGPRVEGLEWAQTAPPQPVAAPVSPQPPQALNAAIVPQRGTVQNPMPGFTTPVADPEALSLLLPSRFAYYGFKDVYVRPFLARHIAKLQKAHREQSLLPIVEAVSSVIYTSDPRYQGRPLAFDLSLPDFYMVLYWLRMNSFTKSNYVHTTRCNNEVHLKRVEDHVRLDEYRKLVHQRKMTPEEFAQIEARALPETTLDISQIISRSELRVIELEKIPDPETYHFSDTSKMIFRPPTMKDVVEFSEAPELQNDDQREEFSFLAQLATHIQHCEFELSLADRVKIVENATADQVELIQQFESELGDYGVVDTVKVTCKECGHVRETRLSIAAHSFLAPHKPS